MEPIEIAGADGESIVFDGATVAKFTHHGKEETARNPASTYRQVQVKPRRREGDAPKEYDVLLAMASFMSLRVDDARRADLERLTARLEGLSGSSESPLR